MSRAASQSSFLLGSLGIAAFLAVWEASRFTGALPTQSFSFPSTMAAALPAVVASAEFQQAVGVSAYQFLVGGLIGLASGVVLALLLGVMPRVNAALRPVFVAGYTIPLIALVPVFVMTLGIGDTTAITIVGTFTFFPVFFVVNGAVVAVDAGLIRMCRAFGGGWADIIGGVVFPSLIPAIVSGARIGLGRGLMGLVVTELFLGTGGIGGYMLEGISSGTPDPAFVAIGVFASFNLVITGVLGGFEKRIDAWRT